MKTNRSLFTLISVFFFWGFVAASNTVLIGLFKKNFELTQFQSQLVDMAFYAAYFIGSLIYFFLSVSIGDPLNKIGYKNGLITGLVISAIGALGFIPASTFQSFPLMLTSLFTIGLGFALQQIVANPYVIALGDPSTGSHRVSLAGGINSFGTTIGPLLLAFAIFGSVNQKDEAWITVNGEKREFPVSIERTTNKTELISGNLVPGNTTIAGENDIHVITNHSDKEHAEYVYEHMQLVGGKAILIQEYDKEYTDEIITNLKNKFPESRIPILTYGDEGYAMLDDLESDGSSSMEIKFLGVDAVKLPSMILAASFLLFALILGLSKLPPIASTEKIEAGMGVFRYPQLIYGMLAIFVYVGVEVAVQSNLPEFMKQNLGLEAGESVHFISLYWGSLMIGRWAGAITVFNLSKSMKNILTVIVPLIAYLVVLGANYIKGSPMQDLLWYFPFVLVLVAGFFLANQRPAFTMMLFGSMAAIMMFIGLFLTGKTAVYFFVSGGLFCSVMWPCIFSLSIAGLGKYTAQGSSLLIMMILGGAIIPPLQGFIADQAGNIHVSYFVPLAGFLFLAFYGWKVKRVLIKQGIDYDAKFSE